ncbi:unnamed protein product, partial [Laminaria digitata]
DQNPFRESSAGVQFFGVSKLNPELYTVQKVVGLVDELVVDNDPEYQWMDNFRQARTSNESRQSLLFKLDATVRRQLGKKVLDLGCNAVLAYQQDFDVEGDSGIVARAYGTACVIQRREPDRTDHPLTRQLSGGHADNVVPSPVKRFHVGGNGSISQDIGSTSVPPPPWASSGTTEGRQATRFQGLALGAFSTEKVTERGFLPEVKLMTLREMDPFVRFRIGGLVVSRSVKYLGKLASKLSDQETRDGWWAELREEIRSHAMLLCCTHVIGYSETTTIHDDVLIMSATGTAAAVRDSHPR